MGLLKTVLIIVLAVYVVRWIDRWNAVRKYNMANKSNQGKEPKTGRVEVQYDPKATKSVLRSDTAEDVDFEEIKD